MYSAFWYGLITLISICLFIYILWKISNRKIVALYTFLAGLTYLFEYVVLVLCGGYEYKTGLLKNTYFDSLVGSIASNAFSVPVAATLIGVFQLNWKWMLSTAVTLALIEELFVYLAIFVHYWWKAIYTVLGLIIIQIISKRWYLALTLQLTGFIRFATLYFSCVLLHATFVFVLVTLFHRYYYEIGWFEDRSRDHVAFATAYVLLMSVLITCLVALHIKWRWKWTALLLTLPLNWLLLEYGILHLSTKWSLWHFLVLRFILLLLLEIFNFYFLGTNDSSRDSSKSATGR